MEISACPVCKIALDEFTSLGNGSIATIKCPNCGSYNLADEYYKDHLTRSVGGLDDRQRATLSFAIRRLQSGARIPCVAQDEADNILRSTSLPTAHDQLSNLILYLGQELSEPGDRVDIEAQVLRAALGSITTRGASWIISQAKGRNLVEGMIRNSTFEGDIVLAASTLTIDGWARFHELQTSIPDCKKAFMAMKFGDEEMNRVFFDCLRPAALRAGYELVKLDDTPRAGLIDDRLRLEIRTARFLIADLTHANPGAYWEAGFAEGLGRPVIYTCKESVFSDASSRPHFDTNHHLSIQWDLSDLSAAADRLTATIRATLPSEAILE
jgi:hypothetical protein